MGVVRLYATLRPRADGDREIEVPWSPGDTVRAVIRELVRYKPGLDGYIVGANGELVRFVSVFVDGRDIRHLEGLDTPLNGAEKIAIFPPVAGG